MTAHARLRVAAGRGQGGAEAVQPFRSLWLWEEGCPGTTQPRCLYFSCHTAGSFLQPWRLSKVLLDEKIGFLERLRGHHKSVTALTKHACT